MADMIYGISLKNKLFEGVELDTDNSLLRSIDSNIGILHIPATFKLFSTAEERNISMFTKNKNKLSISEVSIRYNISNEEAQNAYNKALEMFPEKFI